MTIKSRLAKVEKIARPKQRQPVENMDDFRAEMLRRMDLASRGELAGGQTPLTGEAAMLCARLERISAQLL